MSFESDLDDLSNASKRPSARLLAGLSHLDTDDAACLADAWPALPAERRFVIVSELIDLTEDNVDLNFDAVFKTALTDEWGEVRATAIRGLSEYEGRDLIRQLVDLLRNDPDTGVAARGGHPPRPLRGGGREG